MNTKNTQQDEILKENKKFEIQIIVLGALTALLTIIIMIGAVILIHKVSPLTSLSGINLLIFEIFCVLLTWVIIFRFMFILSRRLSDYIENKILLDKPSCAQDSEIQNNSLI